MESRIFELKQQPVRQEKEIKQTITDTYLQVCVARLLPCYGTRIEYVRGRSMNKGKAIVFSFPWFKSETDTRKMKLQHEKKRNEPSLIRERRKKERVKLRTLMELPT